MEPSRWRLPAECVLDPCLAKLVENYLESRVEDVSRVRTLVLDGSADSLKDIAVIAHRVKGSAAAYGFPLLTKVAKNLEAAARVGDLRLVSELMADWKAFLDRARL